MLSPGLHALLNVERSDDVAMRELTASPVMVDECRRALPALRAKAMEPADAPTVQSIIGRRFALYPQPERTEDEWAEWWDAYIEALDGVTPGAVEAAMAAWVKLPDSQFLPAPGKLRELASMTPNRDVKAYTRAKAAVDYEPPKQIPPVAPQDAKGNVTLDGLLHAVGADQARPRSVRVEPTAADKARVRAMWEECRDKLTKPKDPASEFKPTRVETDSHGVSLEMQALRRQREEAA